MDNKVNIDKNMHEKVESGTKNEKNGKNKYIKSIYWNALPVIWSILTFLVIFNTKSILDMVQNSFLLLAIYFLIAIPYTYIGGKIFKEKKTLAEKIIACELRRKHGYDYCVKCPDSYTCPTKLD